MPMGVLSCWRQQPRVQQAPVGQAGLCHTCSRASLRWLCRGSPAARCPPAPRGMAAWLRRRLPGAARTLLPCRAPRGLQVKPPCCPGGPRIMLGLLALNRDSLQLSNLPSFCAATSLGWRLARLRSRLFFSPPLFSRRPTTLVFLNRSSPPVGYERLHVQSPAEAAGGWVAKLQRCGWPRCGCRVCGHAFGRLAGAGRQCCCLRCPPGVAAPGESLPISADAPSADIATYNVVPLCEHSSNFCAWKKWACWRQFICALVVVSARCIMTYPMGVVVPLLVLRL